MHARGNLDLVISERRVGDYTVQKLNLGNPFSVSTMRMPSYIAFPKKKNLSHLRDSFDADLLKMKKRGEYLQIIRRYGSAE